MVHPQVPGHLSEGAIKVLSAQQVREADEFTILHEPVSSLDLMERAATRAVEEIESYVSKNKSLDVVCGPGNNGGDGLVIARLLHLRGYKVRAWLIRETDKLSDNCRVNRQRLLELEPSLLQEITRQEELKNFGGHFLIDALFGTGVSRRAEGLAAGAIDAINNSGSFVISIDLPSGLYADSPTPSDAVVVNADRTLTFQVPKLCLLFAMNEKYVGDWSLVDIGLDKSFLQGLPCTKYFVTRSQVSGWMEPRGKFSHKGNFGHALLVAGSQGMMGAAVLSAMACLKTGAGLLTVHVPGSGVNIMQSSLPEALVSADAGENYFSGLKEDEIKRATAIGAGPGLSQHEDAQNGIRNLLGISKPLVLDADALNILSLHKDWMERIPANTILTPHPKEFERLTSKSENDFEKHSRLLDFSTKHKVLTILKGAYSCTALPDGTCYFNSTGNPAMATPGSGDVLTGIILGLLAQNFSQEKAAIAGAYIHGLAGDLAAKENGPVGLLASDIARFIPHAFEDLLHE